ncbi:unnamed protein product, partial [Callosobruchus maculatus]
LYLIRHTNITCRSTGKDTVEGGDLVQLKIWKILTNDSLSRWREYPDKATPASVSSSNYGAH